MEAPGENIEGNVRFTLRSLVSCRKGYSKQSVLFGGEVFGDILGGKVL